MKSLFDMGKVARAMAEVRYTDRTWRTDDQCRLLMAHAAFAAIVEQLREPSEDDLRAGVRAFQSTHYGADYLSDWRAAFQTTLSAMLDAAVEEGK